MKLYRRLCALPLALWVGASFVVWQATFCIAQAETSTQKSAATQTSTATVLTLEFLAQPLHIHLYNSSATPHRAIEQLTLEVARLEQQLREPANQQALAKSCETWRAQLKPFFTCHSIELEQGWNQAQERGETPNRTALRKQVRQLNSQPALAANLPLAWKNAWALAQLQEVLAREQLSAQVQLGQLSIRQGITPTTALALPLPPALAEWIGSITLPGFSQGAIASATPATDEWRIEQRRFRKNLNPADGWPNSDSKPVLVFASNALAAQALASALQHMPIQQGLAKTHSLAQGEALVLTHSGRGFALRRGGNLNGAASELPWSPRQHFRIDYQVPNLAIADYRRPYTALWISSAQQPSVRQLQLQGDSPRWLQELGQWWRRHGRRDTSLIDGLSGASATPGSHQLYWDGRDDAGKPVAAGEYELHLEIAREHGEREHLRLPFSLSGQDFEVQKQGKKEVGHIKVGLYTTAD